MLKRYSTEEFLNLLEEKIEEHGGVKNFTTSNNLTPEEISYARGTSRRPSNRLLASLGLRAEKTIAYVSVDEENSNEK